MSTKWVRDVDQMNVDQMGNDATGADQTTVHGFGSVQTHLLPVGSRSQISSADELSVITETRLR